MYHLATVNSITERQTDRRQHHANNTVTLAKKTYTKTTKMDRFQKSAKNTTQDQIE